MHLAMWIALAISTPTVAPSGDLDVLKVVRDDPRQVSVVVQLPRHSVSQPPAARVVVAEHQLPATIAPLLSEGRNLTVVLSATDDPSAHTRLTAAAADLFLRLPSDVRPTLVAGGPEPAVVSAPDKGVPHALRALATLEAVETPGAAQGVRLALEEQASDDPASVSTLVVLTAGGNEQMSPEQLAETVQQSDAALHVVSMENADDDYWSRVVELAGGEFHEFNGESDLVEVLAEEYVLTFGLPLEAPQDRWELSVQSGTDVFSTDLPNAVTLRGAPPDELAESLPPTGPESSRVVAGVAAAVVVGLLAVLTATSGALHRARRAREHLRRLPHPRVPRGQHAGGTRAERATVTSAPAHAASLRGGRASTTPRRQTQRRGAGNHVRGTRT